MITPRTLFRSFARAEFVTWGLLISALIAREFGVAGAVSIAGGIHGFVFLCYGVVTVFVWVNERWKLGIGALGLLTTLVPFATLPFELGVDRRGLLSRRWRLSAGNEAPQSFPEHVQSWVLRHPAISIAIGVGGVVLAFTVLLILGPPVPRDA